MVAAHKKYIFDFEDLHLLSIICNKCNTEIIIDIKNSIADKLPQKCPTCKFSAFDEEFNAALVNFCKVYDVFSSKSENKKVTARIIIRSELKTSEI